ncbi:MAG TPA: hypothetical protein VNI77_01780 [Nitrososphaera sp.]|nr:hypothetical protein [Nitrososphaera sp.]
MIHTKSADAYLQIDVTTSAAIIMAGTLTMFGAPSSIIIVESRGARAFLLLEFFCVVTAVSNKHCYA